MLFYISWPFAVVSQSQQNLVKVQEMAEIITLAESYSLDSFTTATSSGSNGWNIVLFCSLLVLLLLFTVFIRKLFGFKLSLQKLPPGPKGWPFVGCLFLLRRYFTLELEDLVQKYGPIFTLQVVSTPIIIIADADVVREAFVEKGSVFVSRPRVASAALFSSNFLSISLGVYGPVWRTLRKHLASTVTRTSKAANFKNLREEVVQDLLLSRFRDEAAQNGGIVQVRQIIRYGIFELLLSLCFGKHAEESVVLNVAQVLKQINRTISTSSIGIGAFLPWLGFLANWKRTQKHDQQLRRKQVNIILPLVKEAQMLRQDGKLAGGSYIDSLLEVDLQGKKLSDEELVTLCSEFLSVATDSTVTTLEWVMANIISHPHVQSQIVTEIERVVGKRAAKEEDIENLPYLKAVVKETLRRNPPSYFTIPYAVSQPCKLQGYDIPMNAVVLASIKSISTDPRIWDDPTKFKPERFLGSDVDISGSQKITMIPFGTGRRICPGMGLATLHINFILARLMQSFEWSSADPGETIDFTPTLDLAMLMKSPLRALISNR